MKIRNYIIYTESVMDGDFLEEFLKKVKEKKLISFEFWRNKRCFNIEIKEGENEENFNSLI